MAHILESQSREKALITDLQKTDTFNPVGEESKKIKMSNTSNHVKSLQKRNARHVLNIDQMESRVASADNACCRQKSKDE